MDKKGKGSLTVEMSYDFGLLVMSYMRLYLNSGHNTNPV